MFQCPYCNCVIGDDGELSGRCPSCGSLVRWNDDAPTDAPTETTPAPADEVSAAPPLSAGLPRLNDSNASFDRVMQTIVHRAAYEAALADEAAVAPPAEPTPPPTKVVEPGSITRVGNDATIDFGEKNAAAAASPAQIPEVWKGTISPASTPRMTLKSPAVITDAQPGLVIRAKQLRQTGEYGVDDADYELLEQIGEGGVGIVYAARQASVDRTVAIKMLKPESKLDADSRQKFLGEAVVTGDLDHPNIVPIYDLGSDDRGALFYSMKRVRGTPWSEALASKSLPENLEILLKVADAIAFAHSRGIVHRDIKPENVMLGDFGEVLVMDWGIALSTNVCLRAGSITQSQSMGGTPAYMSPEMATGPIERIGNLSDVYLLGGVLFEVITGHPPHTGQDVLACLYAAARNEIRPTEKSGELLDIAYHAMATDPAARHASVREFQDAIRTYQSHSESIALSSRAATDLRTAQRTLNYQDFARAVFAAQEALALWRKNESAATVLEQSQLAYAECAHAKEDFDLGLSLLDEFNVTHQPLIKKLVQGQHERATRQRRVRQLRNMAAALAVVILTVVSVGLIYIRGKNQTLNAQNEQLGKQTQQLVQNESNLKELNSSLKDKSEDLRKQKEKVELTATDLARQRTVAEASARQAIDKERFAEQVSYLSQIGLAAAQTRENAFLNIRQSLRVYNHPKLAHLRNWEWGRLNFLSSLAQVDQPADGRVESLATAADDSSFLVTGTSSGALQFWNTANWQATTHALPQAIRTVALSHDGRRLAMASVDAEHRILIWDTAAWRKLAPGAPAPRPAHTLTGHKDAVLHLSFDATGERVLSTSQDQTARLWNLKTEQAVEFTGHAGPVWTGVISSDGLRVFTAGDDRTVGIWNAATGARIERFRGHKGPVYCVACIAGGSADDYQVVSAGADRRLLLWNAAEVRGVDFKAVRARIVGEVETETTSDQSTPYRVLGSHMSDVYDLRFARDSRFVVSCGHDNTVRVWDRSAADERSAAYRVLRGHGGWVQACAMLDDRHVVSAGYDQSLKVWDLATYREVITLAGHEDAIMAANYSRDGSRIITAGRDRKALIWDANTGELVTTLDEGHNFLTSMVQFFGPHDQRMLTSAGDGSSIIWNIKTGSQLQRLTGTGSQGAAAISPDKQWIITGSSDKTVRVWRVGDVDAAPLTLHDHSASITCVAATQPAGASHPIFFSGDGSGRGNLWTWDDSASSWKIAGQVAHYSGFAITAASFTPDGRTLITAGADHRVRQWSASDGKEHVEGVLQHPDAVRLMRLSPSGELLVTMTSLPAETQLLQVWNLPSRQVIHEHRLQQVSVQGLAISPDSKTLAFCDSSPGNTVWRMDLATGKVQPFWANGRLQASVWGLAYTPDGAALATVGGNRARLWSVAAGERLQSFSPHGPLSTADFSPSGKLALTAGSDGVAKVWNLADQQVVAKLAGGHNTADGRALPIMKAMFLSESRVLTLGEEGHACIWQLADGEAQLVRTLIGKAPWTTIAAAPSGQRMLAGTKSGALEWWNLTAEEQPIAWQADDGHTLSVSAAAISADGRYAITGAQDNIAIIWDTTTGKIVQRLKGHTAGITAVGFSPDVRRALTASDDGTAKLWDIASGVEILAFDAHQSEVTATSFSPQGNQILTASRDRTALLWTITAIPPALGLRDERLSYRQPDVAQPIDSEPVFTDADVTTFAGAKLTITIHGAPIAGLTDELQLRGVAGNKLTRQGDELYFQSDANAEPVAVGSVHYDPSAARLEVTFLAAANHQAVEQTLASVNYRAKWREIPPDDARSITLSYTDAEGLTSPPLSKPVSFEADADELVTVSH